MAYRSDVKILMGEKAYELLKNNCLKSDKDYVREMVERPSWFEENDDNSVLIGWSYVKWYNGYEDVKAVELTLRELDGIIEEDDSKLNDYFYKKIEIGEDNRTEESTNDYDDEFVSDFYVECNFSI